MQFSAVLSLLGIGPKTLPQAQATLETAKSTFDSVDAMFSSAGLNLEQMLAAGPDALKAHIASLGAKDVDLAAAQAKTAELEGKLAAAASETEAANAKFSAIGAALEPLGITATTKPEEYSAVVAAHVKQAASLELAKTGHAPVAIVTPEQIATPSADASRAAHYEYMSKLPEGEQRAYFKKHLERKF
jgi:hypothetical protein